MYKNLIFDLDGTLCKCGPYYIEAKEEFIRYQVDRTKVPASIVESIVSHIDVQCTNLEHGFNRTRFPRSFEATSLALDSVLGNPLDIRAAEHSFFIGNSVFSQPYPLFEGVSDTLQSYKADGFNLFLYTLGDYEVQSRKIDINNLRDIFPNDHIYIVSKKVGTALQVIIDDHNLNPSETIVIGDSLRGDIGSAHAVGIDSIWVKQHTNVGWAYENQDNAPTYTIDEVPDLPQIIPVSQPHLQ